MIRESFDRFVRIYAMSFLILIFIAFIVNEFIAKEYINYMVKSWLFFNIFLVFIAFILQRKLWQIVAGDPNKLSFLAYVVNEDKLIDNVQLILHSQTHIPPDIETYDVNANYVLQFSHQNPYLYDISHTVYDHKFIRFSWLAIKKNPIDLLSKLKTGDIILYHKQNSIIGKLIRFFTRCYWEHSAIYIGDGVSIEASPGGVKKVKINPWIVDNTVFLGVLRPDINLQKKSAIAVMEKHIGDGYAYHKIFHHWWRIVTGNTRLGLMTPLIFLLNIIQFSIALFVVFSFPSFTRLQIATILLTGPYMFDSIYHKVAYVKDLSFFNERRDEKS